MWVQGIGAFECVQRDPWFLQIFKSKKNEGILRLQRLPNGNFQKKVITQIGGTV